MFKFKGTWYAITSSSSAGTILWKLEGSPISTRFTYLRTIFKSGYENFTIYPVVALNREIQLMLSIATDAQYETCRKIYIEFNSVKDYKSIGYKIWAAGHIFSLDPWYIYINQDQSSARASSELGIIV
uniref:Uncharacterized protein n=1 Tax=Ignisphaera aggregans TaxID=334771 RepID=A0A7J3QF89_9CREN